VVSCLRFGEYYIKTKLHLEKLANRVSQVLCGGVSFTYGAHSIWEEIPSMYIDKSIMGMLIIIGGYGGEEGFSVEISQYGEFSRYVYQSGLRESEIKIKLDLHLFHLLKEGLKEFPEIEVVEP
jgi:hypothetical protein